MIEVMVSLAIFLIVSAAVLGLVMLSLGTVRANADRVYAAALARETLDDIRALPAQDIPLGQTVQQAATDAGDFTITTESTWVDLGASVNPCDAGEGVLENGASYLRVFVTVEGGELKGPQQVEAVIYPTDAGQGQSPEVATDDTGTMTIAVRDIDDQPISGVVVQGALTGANPDSFSQTTGATGCLFVPDLIASPDWKVTLGVPAGYMTESESGNLQPATVDTLLNTPVTFTIAQPGTVTFTAGTDGFPVPEGMPFEFDPDARNLAPTTFSTFPVQVSGLWPATYSAWLRPCIGALEGSVGTAALPQGGSATVSMTGTKLQLVGPPEGTITAVYAPQTPIDDVTGEPVVGWTPPCAASYDLGTWDATAVDGVITPLSQVMLPAGTWEITTESGSTTVYLDPLNAKCSVPFPVDDAQPAQTPEQLVITRSAYTGAAAAFEVLDGLTATDDGYAAALDDYRTALDAYEAAVGVAQGTYSTGAAPPTVIVLPDVTAACPEVS